MKAMILAAGRGERLRPLTDSLPKPLVEVAGKPLIVYHIEKLAAAGFTEIVINHAWLGHKLVEALGDGRKWQVNIQYSEETSALETGGGIKQALTLLGDEAFLAINGDIFLDELPQIKPLKEGALAHLWLVDNPVQHPQGDFVLQEGKVSAQGHDKLTFSGVGVYHPHLFKDTPDGAFALAPLLRQAMAKGLVGGAHFKQYWCDVGTMERLAQIQDRETSKVR
ncbi:MULTISPECIES: N-acetylmuramate alpha-1-phosphate uridylyltransferase MurU [unclassified Shewanella]|uniref:N-acetylmuramate alpha-1-phosphate uridylyltransferase MurU n=1 Tax=unclassified Shewanella TaxID=196818 RepID=UPI001BC610AD|nr:MULTISPECIES: nucleotidyltransferase family protein [unclassified Shewanella]GIU11860.1 mannose-1-phosphate guanylyltransferase [Shewanella sp. MBTL60-112-B1]GIU31977.1 mannose-1-phosphate guanylyltransferase [Shewanella sp. MBTL60-112-B2]